MSLASVTIDPSPERDERRISLRREADHWTGRFIAMACPCEVLIEDAPHMLAQQVVRVVAECAWRIERKFSRYRHDNIVDRINTANGEPVVVDDETGKLLDFAATLTHLSAGRFDITSGVLRRVWTFDGGDRVPAQAEIDALLPSIGWHRADWRRPRLTLPAGMQIDFGGIGKEYAVDAAARLAAASAPGVSCVVNFGGDVAVLTPRRDRQPWRVGIESAASAGAPLLVVPLMRGALATSGDARRFVLRAGKRYSHILDARTGWPVEGAPHSVTVAADTCTQAGTLTTLAMLEGAGARQFLESTSHPFWLQ